MRLHHLLTSLFVLPSYSLYILLPLYIYPEDGSWAPLINAVTAHPAVDFQIIINPDSGPGASQYPDPGYIAGIAQLNQFPNTQLLGYVHTSYAARPYADVTADINVYAGWANYTAADISLGGIFFDEVTASTNRVQKQYMKNISSYARSQIGNYPFNNIIVFNPGEVIDKSYFAYCDTIVEFEDTYSNYQGQATINTFQPLYHQDTAIIINEVSVDKKTVKSLVQTMQVNGIGGVYLTSDCCYNSFNTTLLNALTAAVDPLGGF